MSHPGRTLRTGLQVARPGVPAGLVLDEDLIGRIEEWVVSTLDDRNPSSSDAEWMNSLEAMTLTKRTVKVPDVSLTAPTPSSGWARFRLSRRRGVTVVSLTDQALVKEEDLDELIGDLLALVEAGHRRIVLDFFAVERLSSWAASSIDRAVRRSSDANGATIKFSGVHAEVASMFAMTGLDPRVSTYPDSASAISGIWPDLPDLRPLPVSILAALMRAEETRHHRPRSQGCPRFRAGTGMTIRIDEDHHPMTGARLIVQDGPSAGRPIVIKGPKFVIGRGPDCQLRVGSATVSRSHAGIVWRDGRLFLRDLASTNGTILNGRTLHDREAELRDGDRIRVGKLSFSVEFLRLERAEDIINSLFPEEVPEFPGMDVEADSTEQFDLFVDPDLEIGLKHEVIEGTLIITPLVTELDQEAEVNALRDALISLAGRNLPKRVVINLGHISHLSGRAIGVLVAHHLRLDRSGGALRVCLANPRVAVVLEQVKLGMLVECHPTVEDAVIAAWPEPAETTARS